MILNENSVLSVIVREYVQLLPMLNRFGIKLGLGEETVKSICEKKDIDTDFFLHMANSFLDTTYLRRVNLSRVYPGIIADYLTQTNLFYEQAQLPNIEVHLRPFIMHDKNNNSLQLLPKVLDRFRVALRKRISYDNEQLIPYFLELSKKVGEDINDIVLDKEFEERYSDDSSEALISDIQDVIVKHLTGDFNDNLCYAVLFSLSMIEKDLASNNRLRERIFYPMLRAMEKLLDVPPYPLITE